MIPVYTAKERALMLYDKGRDYVLQGRIMTDSSTPEWRETVRRKAKEFATFIAGEIMHSILINEPYAPRAEYWKEVIEEIQKL